MTGFRRARCRACLTRKGSPKSGRPPLRTAGEGPVKPPSTPPGKAPPEAAPVSPPVLASHHEMLTIAHLSQPVNLFHYVAFFGQPLLLVGFLLVLLSRGCDVIGERYAERVKAKWQVTESRFQDEWAALTRRFWRRGLSTFTEKPRPTPADEKQIESLQKQLDTLEKERKAEEGGTAPGPGRTSSERVARCGRESADVEFLAGRRVLAAAGRGFLPLGLLILGFTGETVERWMCLVMLAIIVFRLYAAAGG